jgi:branched-chain amino acid transport system permease protein
VAGWVQGSGMWKLKTVTPDQTVLKYSWLRILLILAQDGLPQRDLFSCRGNDPDLQINACHVCSAGGSFLWDLTLAYAVGYCGTVWLLLLLTAVAAVMEATGSFLQARVGARRWQKPSPRRLRSGIVAPCAGLGWQVLVTMLIVTPLLYRVAPPLTVQRRWCCDRSSGGPFALVGLGLLFFGAGVHYSFLEAQFNPALAVSGRACDLYHYPGFIGLLAWFFGKTFITRLCGRWRLIAAGAPGGNQPMAGIFLCLRRIGCLSAFSSVQSLRVLRFPVSDRTEALWRDRGGLASCMLAAGGALAVGIVNLRCSGLVPKVIIVFTIIIPILLWHSVSVHYEKKNDTKNGFILFWCCGARHHVPFLTSRWVVTSGSTVWWQLVWFS